MDVNLDASRVNHNCVRHDRKMGGRTVGNHDLRMNDLLVYQMTGVNLLTRNYAPRDPKMDVNLDAMNHRVMLMDDLNISCDQMSHDRLRCDHLMMRRHDTNRMDARNLDARNLDVNHPKTDDPMRLHRVNRRMLDDRLKGDQKMI